MKSIKGSETDLRCSIDLCRQDTLTFTIRINYPEQCSGVLFCTACRLRHVP